MCSCGPRSQEVQQPGRAVSGCTMSGARSWVPMRRACQVCVTRQNWSPPDLCVSPNYFSSFQISFLSTVELIVTHLERMDSMGGNLLHVKPWPVTGGCPTMVTRCTGLWLYAKVQAVDQWVPRVLCAAALTQRHGEHASGQPGAQRAIGGNSCLLLSPRQPPAPSQGTALENEWAPLETSAVNSLTTNSLREDRECRGRVTH